jgi:hypothetical protein
VARLILSLESFTNNLLIFVNFDAGSIFHNFKINYLYYNIYLIDNFFF